MQQGHDNGLLIVANTLVGVNLGADYCAEHEWGIDSLREKFGIDNTKNGLEKRKITRLPEYKNLSDFEWVDNQSYSTNSSTKISGIYCWSVRYDDKPLDLTWMSIRSSKYEAKGKIDLYTAWDERSFCALSSEVETIAYLKEVYQAFTQFDIAIWQGGGGPFQNAGLCLGIASRLPKEITDNWLVKDLERNQLLADAEATGIKELLDNAKKEYFALSPSREPDGSVKFWLNPRHQNRYEAGWFTVAQLKQWINEEGPVIKKNSKRSR